MAIHEVEVTAKIIMQVDDHGHPCFDEESIKEVARQRAYWFISLGKPDLIHGVTITSERIYNNG